MNAKHKRRWFQFSIRSVLFIALIVNLYLGSYQLLLRPAKVTVIGDRGWLWSHREPRFLIGGVASQVVYSPLIWIDRRIHSDYWDEYLDEF